MKQLNGDYQPSPNVSTGASTSNQSKYDQESGSNTMLTQKDVTGNANFSCHLPFGIDSTLARILVAEALGTFMLVFCIYGITASTQIIGGQVGLLEYGLTAIIAVTVVVSSIGGISGAHVNPAVTIAFATVGPFPWSKVPAYIVAQIVGATGGTYIGKLVYGMKAELIVTRPIQGSASAFFAEFIVTFIFLFMACSLINEAQAAVAGLVVGASIGLGILITVPVSGGSMNPARSLGPAIVAWKFDDLWIYIVAPTAGAVAGSLSYRVLCLRCNVNGSTSASIYNNTTTQNRFY